MCSLTMEYLLLQNKPTLLSKLPSICVGYWDRMWVGFSLVPFLAERLTSFISKNQPGLRCSDSLMSSPQELSFFGVRHDLTYL